MSSQKKFELVSVVIMDADGSKREYKVVKDVASFARIESPGGPVLVGTGYIRCTGKRYVGTYGRQTPVYVGGVSDVYYTPASYFDGRWSHSGPDDRGCYSAVTEADDLFAALEQFSATAE